MTRSTPTVRVARAAAVAFALFVLGWLVWNAQRGPHVPLAPSGEDRLLRDPVIGPIEDIPLGPTLLPSTKSARLDGVVPVPVDPGAVKAAKPPRTFLPSTKTITVMPVPDVPDLRFPPSKPPGPDDPKR